MSNATAGSRDRSRSCASAPPKGQPSAAERELGTDGAHRRRDRDRRLAHRRDRHHQHECRTEHSTDDRAHRRSGRAGGGPRRRGGGVRPASRGHRAGRSGRGGCHTARTGDHHVRGRPGRDAAALRRRLHRGGGPSALPGGRKHRPARVGAGDRRSARDSRDDRFRASPSACDRRRHPSVDPARRERAHRAGSPRDRGARGRRRRAAGGDGPACGPTASRQGRPGGPGRRRPAGRCRRQCGQTAPRGRPAPRADRRSASSARSAVRRRPGLVSVHAVGHQHALSRGGDVPRL